MGLHDPTAFNPHLIHKEGRMVVTAFRKDRIKGPEIIGPETESADWITIAACGTLISGGILLLTGKKRAGLIAAASGTILAMIEHEESLRELWDTPPHYVDRARSVMDQVQQTVDKIADRSQSVRRALGR